MLYTPHFLTGAAVLSLMPSPLVGIPLALLSHILLDLTPHHDFDITPGMNLADILKIEKKRNFWMLKILVVDGCLLLLSFFWLLLFKNNWWLVVGGVAGIFPDLVEQLSFVLLRKTLPGWQNTLQWRIGARYGFLSYPIVSFLALLVLWSAA